MSMRRNLPVTTPLQILVPKDESLVADHVEDSLNDTFFDVAGRSGVVAEALGLAAGTHPRLAIVHLPLHGCLDWLESAQLLRRRFGTAAIPPSAGSRTRAACGWESMLLREPLHARQLHHALASAAQGAGV